MENNNKNKSIKQDLIDEFVCPICLLILTDPLMTSCSHLFCDECIKKWIHEDQRCPICKCLIDSKRSRQAYGIYHVLAKLRALQKISESDLPDAEQVAPIVVSTKDKSNDPIECIEIEPDSDDEIRLMNVPKRKNGRPQVVYLI